MASEIYQKLTQAVIDGVPEDAKALAQEALDKELDVQLCIIEGLAKGVEELGRSYASGECPLPDLLHKAEAMEAALDIFEPALSGNPNREVIALLVLEKIDDSPDENSKILIGTMLSDDNSMDGESLPFLRWIS